ncbi:MAG: hypothetical protein IKS17_02920 [Firmicutes bacterium]|nr:hypothetical protein [Bacillota bacterium]
MGDYIKQIGCLTVLAAFVQMLAGDRFRRDTGFITGLIILAAVCAPLKGLTAAQPDVPDIDIAAADTSGYESMQKSFIRDAVGAELEKAVAQKTGAQRVSVSLGDDLSVQKVILYNAPAGSEKTAAAVCGTDEGGVIMIAEDTEDTDD